MKEKKGKLNRIHKIIRNSEMKLANLFVCEILLKN